MTDVLPISTYGVYLHVYVYYVKCLALPCVVVAYSGYYA